MKRQLLLGHIISLLIGGLIYIFFRVTTLKMFGWYSSIGLERFIKNIRKLTLHFTSQVPEWILYSLPDGLWIFSYICLMLLIWHNNISSKNAFWVLAIPTLAICSEIGQSLNFVPGTFDFFDLLSYIFGMTLPFIFFNKQFLKLKF